MVIGDSALRGRVLSLNIPEKGTDFLHISSLSGSEGISRPYEFKLKLLSKDKEIESDAMIEIGGGISLTIRQAVPRTEGSGYLYVPHRIHGVFSSFLQGGQFGSGEDTWNVYEAVLVPRLWTLGNTIRTRIFMDQTFIQILESVLTEHGLQPDTDFDLKNLEAGDVQKHPEREFVVQHDESDLDFISRWMEHEGISYLFHHDQESGSGEKVIFTEKTEGFPSIQGNDQVPYREISSGDGFSNWVSEESVSSLLARHDKRPAKVELSDYNYRKASLGLRQKGDAKSVAGGMVHLHGDHFKTTEEGDHLAVVRAQELECRERIFTGVGNCKSFRAGHTFSLKAHHREGFNQRYLLTGVEHEATHERTGDVPALPEATYRGTFTAIPLKVTTKGSEKEIIYRPKRVTPKPRVEGSINAKVDSGGDFAELDSLGRYKIRFPWDSADVSEGKASRYVRKIEPYGGPGYGMHFPLHNGVEVAVGFVNADPDRPIILGSVANSDNASCVTGGNNVECVLSTGGGNRFVINDDIGRIELSTPSASTQLFMGEDVGSTGVHWRTEQDYVIDCEGFFEFQTKGDHKTFVEEGDNVLVVEKGMRRINIKKDQTTIVEGELHKLDVVTGNQETHIGGDQTVTVDGKYSLKVTKPWIHWNYDATRDWFFGNKFSYTISTDEKLHAGVSATVRLGLTFSSYNLAVVSLYKAKEKKRNFAEKTEEGTDKVLKYNSWVLDVTKGSGEIKMKNGDWTMDVVVAEGFELAGKGNHLILSPDSASLDYKGNGIVTDASNSLIKFDGSEISVKKSTIDIDSSTVNINGKIFSVK